ncbi:MAG: ABC transporter substrate-binding protein [Pseudomonadota bacterium]
MDQEEETVASSATGTTEPQSADPSETTEATNSSDKNGTAQEKLAEEFVQSLLDDAENALQNDEATDAERLAAFQAVLQEGLALAPLSKFIIGRGVYSEFTDEQRERYDAAFPDYISNQYAKQFDGILGNPLVITETTPYRKDIFVRTQFVRPEGSPLNVDWRIRNFSSGPQRLIDIIVQGASIMSVKRSEFAEYVKANGVDALLTEIETSQQMPKTN